MNRCAIIAGSNKAGTTSLFRYLAAHPEVCPSKIKEMNFFSKTGNLDSGVIAEQYISHFAHCKAGSWCSLEASPDYLRKGKVVAEKIRGALPDVKLIVMIREPASRIISYFSSNKQNKFHKNVSEIQFSEFLMYIRDSKTRDFESLEAGPEKNAFIQFQRGYYAKYLQEFLRYFPAEQIHILFFDDLVNDTCSAVSRVADFLGLDTGFYDEFLFSVENKAKQARWPAIQRYVFRMNVRLEPIMNTIPVLRVMGKKLMFKDKARSMRLDIYDADIRKLRGLYEEENMELSHLLSEIYPSLHLPSWLP